MSLKPKGGVERAVQVAKNDLLPKDTNLRESYKTLAEFAAAIDEFNDRVNRESKGRYGKTPAELMAVEASELRPVVAENLAAAGEKRMVGANTPMISYKNVSYSVPHTLVGQEVWVRCDPVKRKITIKQRGEDGSMRDIAVHTMPTDGSDMVVCDEHFPPGHPTGPMTRKPRPMSSRDRQFCAIGDQAVEYVRLLTRKGVKDCEKRIDEINRLTAAHGTDTVNTALGLAVRYNRLTINDVRSLIVAAGRGVTSIDTTSPLPDNGYLTCGTSSWYDMSQEAS